jgi:hypothetical protein
MGPGSADAAARQPDGAAPALRFVPDAESDDAVADAGSVQLVVLDTTWIPDPADQRVRGSIDILEAATRVLAEHDILAEATAGLDAWAEAAGVVDAMSIDGTSFWFYVRLRHWMWLHDRILWSEIVDDLVARLRPSAIECADGVDAALADAGRATALRDGLAFRAGEAVMTTAASDPDQGPGDEDPRSVPSRAASSAASTTRSLGMRIAGRIARLGGGGSTDEVRADRARLLERLDRFAAVPGSLLVVLAHARQRVESPGGARWVNAYLDPISDELRGTRLDPIDLDLTLRLADDGWAQLDRPGSARTLPTDTLGAVGSDDDGATLTTRAEAAAARIEGSGATLLVAGVDLGPTMAGRVADDVRRSLPGKTRAYGRIRRLLRRLRPAGVLLAVEYHRQEWLAAAAAEGIPSAAVQHGIIHRWNTGYIHATRPAGLRLPDRTYLFGEWERRLLTTSSVYRDDELVVGGSPRLDLVHPDAVDRDAVRSDLGIAPGDRMVVVSGTWGPLYRRFYFPIALAALFDRPMPRVHVVIKLHPSETDEGPYRAVIEGVARAGGFAPPPISVVQRIDLYRLLAAADAHLGIHSTVLTEAVATGTPNLLASMFASADLLGYVDAGVATAVRTGADVLAALDDTPDPDTVAAARRAFLDAHFEPGSASERIAADLLAWLP